MVAEQQSKRECMLLERPLVSLAIAYDGKPKVDAAQHAAEVKAAYKSGYDEASSQYNKQILDFRSEINALRESTFSQLEGRFQNLVMEAREALMTLTYECVKQTLGGFEMTADAVEKIVEAVVREAGLDDEQMDLRLHSLDIALLEDLASDLVTRHPGLRFVPDDSLKRGDCVLKSRFGKIDALMATKLEKLKGSLKPT